VRSKTATEAQSDLHSKKLQITHGEVPLMGVIEWRLPQRARREASTAWNLSEPPDSRLPTMSEPYRVVRARG
jgi:hypothetical protein